MADGLTNKISSKLARARESKGLTLQQLAKLSGVAPSTIQKIEAGTMMPSIAVMMKIARGLHKKIGFFLDEEDGSSEVSLVRRRDRDPSSKPGGPIPVRSLSGNLVDPTMDGFVLTLRSGASSGKEPLHHGGDELVFCIKGKVTFSIDGEDYTLGPGDSLHFKSDRPHSWKNSGRSTAELLMVCSLPSFSEQSVFRKLAPESGH